MKQQLLLKKDVDGLGRKGDIVTARPGYVRNFLLPQGMAVVANKHTLLEQAKLKEERAKQAIVDRKESEELAARLSGFVLKTKVRVDPEGNLYGSVSAHEIASLMQKEGFDIERRSVSLAQSIKVVGTHAFTLKLKEGITVPMSIEVEAEEEMQIQARK